MTRIDWELLARYDADDCTADERREVERWTADSAEHAQVLAGVRDAIARANATVTVERRTAMWATLEREMRADIGAARPLPMRGFSTRPAQTWWGTVGKIAAAVALTVGVGLVGRIVYRSMGVASPVAAEGNVIATARGQRLSIRLADGTLVTLAPGTTLRTASTYGVHDRTVRLEGEAAFTVVHDATRPFAVRTAHAVARDLGTRFVVRAYPGDSLAEVVVAEGLVAVAAARGGETRAGADSIVVERGGRVRVGADGALALVRDVPLDDYFAWTDGRLVFRDTPLADVAVRMTRWYGVEVRLAPGVETSLPVTATFEHQPAVDALRRIALSLNLAVRQEGRAFIVGPK